MNMSRQETLNSRYGEFMDLLACLSILHGAKPKKKKKIWTFDEFLNLR
jgi:hypothetical protein